MNFIQTEIKRYLPALILDEIISRRRRRGLLKFLSLLVLLLVASILGSILYDSVMEQSLTLEIMSGNMRFVVSLFFILLAPFGALLQLTFYYNSLFFRGLNDVLKEDLSDDEGITFEVASICRRAKDDLLFGFLTSSYGSEIMLRLGIGPELIDEFLTAQRKTIHPDSIPVKPTSFITLQDVGEFLYTHDTLFKTFLFKHGVTESHFRGANEWASRTRMLHKQRIRWWSRDTLGKITGIGKEFSYGIAFGLERYMRDIRATSALSLMLHDVAYANEVIVKVETILARSKAANVIMVGEPGVGQMDMLIELGERIRDGRSVSSLTAKRLIVFDADMFIATHNSKETFERAFINLVSEAEQAGNIIMVIENFSHFMSNVASLGTDVSDLITRFLSSPNIQIIATVDPGNYHQSLENNQRLLQHFVPVLVEVPDLTSTIRVLEEATWVHERLNDVFFTYPALVRIAESADRYIIDGVMPDKAVNLLVEIASLAVQDRRTLILPDFVDMCVSQKTGIMIGTVQDEERELLVHLEEILHKRVVGQENAIQAIASTMRRARAGIQSKEKPIGSFLFLGSTGVGKTETAKALAFTFFGSEEHMVRFDMSEYSDVYGLPRLLGTRDSVGALTSALHEHPYGVLLLDEFEKASASVHDLFLQVLDEGIFTDGRGTRVNARNAIIIATSNAGSDMIRSLADENKLTQDAKGLIVRTIIEHHVFKPELINRFDSVILFEPLNADAQKNIARLMLEELKKRIEEHGYSLVVDDVLLTALMHVGYNHDFGARPMRRAIQDVIEEKVAFKIIEGGLKPGDTIQFTADDFKN